MQLYLLINHIIANEKKRTLQKKVIETPFKNKIFRI